MTVARGFQGSLGYVKSGLLGVHRDPTKWIALKEPPTITPEITQIDSRLFNPGAYHLSDERLQGMFNYSGSFQMVLHPEEGVELLAGVLGSVSSSELTGAGSGIYQHTLTGSDSVPMAQGFSVTVNEDLAVKYIHGLVVTSVEISVELNGEAIATVNWIARKVETGAAGTSGTSQGEDALSFNLTITEDSNDDFKLAVDGGTVYECTIAAGTYTTAADLQAAINTAILAQSSLQDSGGLPEVACYIDDNDKVNFYTSDKGTGASVAWTAGTNDAGTVLGRGTPVEAAGTASLATPSYSSVQPFTATQLTVKQDTTSICATSCTLTIDAKIIARNCLGSKYMKEPIMEGKREVTIEIAKEYENNTAFEAWEANSNVEFELDLLTGTEIIASSGVNYELYVYLKKCRINNTPEPAFNGAGAMTQTINATSFYYDSTYKDIQMVVNNTISAMP